MMDDGGNITWKNLALLSLALLVAGLWLGVPPALGDDESGAMIAPVDHALTIKECTSCHMAYPAALLPARSWQRMMRELENHFGDDASLDPAQASEIARYLADHAADSAAGGARARKWAESIAPGQTPLRITETRYFKYLHDEVPAGVWKRARIGSPAHCDACHTRAAEGRFPEREIRIPK
jgi:hypothetical protein